MIGLTVAGLAVGSMFTPPAAMANASVLPDSHVGTPDAGYPSMGPWRGCDGGCPMMGVLPTSDTGSPDIGYPHSCGSSCDANAQSTTMPSSGDVG